MTLPRRFLPDQIKAITRRTVNRQLFLLPLPEVRQILEYALGVALTRYPSVHLFALVTMGNHTHTMAHDARAEGETPCLSEFFRDFHGLVARALNCFWGRGGALWDDGSFDDVDVFGERTLEEQLLYLWTNPTSAGLSERLEAWPGLSFGPEDFGRTFTVEKPRTAFFTGAGPQAERCELSPESQRLRSLREEEAEARRLLREREQDRARGRTGSRRRQLKQERRRRRKRKERAPRSPQQAHRSTLPDVVTYTIHRPPGYEHLSDDELRAHFRNLLDVRLGQLHAERHANGFRRFMSRENLLAQRPTDAPSGGTRPTHARNPRIACKDKERRIGEILRLQEWRKRYRSARDAWAGGNHSVSFPEGTYGLPRFHAARVERAPPLAA